MTTKEKQNLKDFVDWVYESNKQFDSAPKNRLHQTSDRLSKAWFSLLVSESPEDCDDEDEDIEIPYISAEKLKKLAKSHPPDQSWYEE